MFSRLGGHRVVRVAVVVTLVLALGVAVRVAMTSGPEPYKGPPAIAVSGYELVYAAAPGQANDLTVTETSEADWTTLHYDIDDVVPIEAGTGCRHPRVKDRTRVYCTVRINDMETDPLVTLSLRLGDGDDTAVIHNRTSGNPLGYNEIYLGSGNDTWTGTGREARRVHGGNGDGTLTVGAGGNVDGGPGDDTVYGPGANTVQRG